MKYFISYEINSNEHIDSQIRNCIYDTKKIITSEDINHIQDDIAKPLVKKHPFAKFKAVVINFQEIK